MLSFASDKEYVFVVTLTPLRICSSNAKVLGLNPTWVNCMWFFSQTLGKVRSIQCLIHIGERVKTIDDVTYVYIQTTFCWQNTVHIMFPRAKRCVVMVRLHTLSRWLPKHKGFLPGGMRANHVMVFEWRQRSHCLYCLLDENLHRGYVLYSIQKLNIYYKLILNLQIYLKVIIIFCPPGPYTICVCTGGLSLVISLWFFIFSSW